MVSTEPLIDNFLGILSKRVLGLQKADRRKIVKCTSYIKNILL